MYALLEQYNSVVLLVDVAEYIVCLFFSICGNKHSVHYLGIVGDSSLVIADIDEIEHVIFFMTDRGYCRYFLTRAFNSNGLNGLRI